MVRESSISPMHKIVKSAYNAFLQLEKSKGSDRSRAIKAMAQGLKRAFDQILEANTSDLVISREMAIPELLLDWLKLTPERLQKTVEVLEDLAQLTDPLQRVRNAIYQLNTCQTYCQLMPLGTIAFIYEGFPEIAAIAAGLAIKTGNVIILRGGSEAAQSNATIAQILQTAIEEVGLSKDCLQFISAERGGSIQELITQDQHLNLVIPYGRPSLTQEVLQIATAPVLKSAMGNCYLYWSSSGDLDLVRFVIADSHASQPDAVNAIEKVLVNANHKASSLTRLWSGLSEKGYKLRGDEELVAQFPEHLTLAKEDEWSVPYLNKTIAFRKIETMESAIAWINQHSSGHADCLITESYQESRQFSVEVDSALVYINSSPRFSRNPKGSKSVFLGMSNQKGYRRGLIGLETLTTLKQVVQGDGKQET
jgi:glutamate-5-semialdehyde dehydrogenase